jgi:phospholipid-binding lipoprotein MlaA
MTMFRAGLKKLFVVGLVFMNAGCTTLPQGHVQDPRDPWERYNRAMFEFNEEADRLVIKPVSEAYRDYTPDLLQFLLRNFFSNLWDIATTVQYLLQARPPDAANSAARVLFNTTLGFGGLGDPASEMGFQKTYKDFGMTLGYWGVEPGPYFVWPILGPNTVRDSFGFVGDLIYDPMRDVIKTRDGRTASYVVEGMHRRIDVLKAEGTIEALSFDRYSSVRDAWLARRKNQIYDGNPPPEPFSYDLDE